MSDVPLPSSSDISDDPENKSPQKAVKTSNETANVLPTRPNIKGDMKGICTIQKLILTKRAYPASQTGPS